MNVNEKLSDHFTIGELTASDTAARKGIDNTPGPEVIANLRLVAATLEKVRAINGKPIVVSSGYRSVALNKAVGGVPNSDHIKGLAADINCPGLTPFELGLAIQSAGIEFDQMIHEFGSWVHISVPQTGVKPRHELLSIKRGGPYVKGWVK